MDDCLPKPHVFPSFAIVDSFAFTALKYGFVGELTEAAVLDFCERYLNKQLEPSRRSDKVRVC
jgi:hypothetical protein